MPQHDVNSKRPLPLKAARQPCHVIVSRLQTRPHLGLISLEDGIEPDETIVTHARQAKPGEIPAAVALRVCADARVGLLHQVRAEGVPAREAA